MAQTDQQTSGHRDSMTESAQWGQFSENQRGAAHVFVFNGKILILQ